MEDVSRARRFSGCHEQDWLIPRGLDRTSLRRRRYKRRLGRPLVTVRRERGRISDSSEDSCEATTCVLSGVMADSFVPVGSVELYNLGYSTMTLCASLLDLTHCRLSALQPFIRQCEQA